jgi:hypothetical protein
MTQEELEQKILAALKDKDVGIAKAYADALAARKNPGDPIDRAGAEKILDRVLDGKEAKGKPAITPDEAVALTLLLEYAVFSPDADAVFQQRLFTLTADKDIPIVAALMEGAAERLKGDKLKAITKQLDIAAIGNLNFYSVGLKHTYSPHQYMAIAQLMAAKKNGIEVYAVKDNGLMMKFADLGGTYRSDANRLLLFQSNQEVLLKVLIVHEVTHAVQDWLDLPTTDVNAIETDGYIAGAMVLKAHSMKPSGPGAYKVAHENTSQIILDGQATESNQAWITAYNLVKDEVAKDPLNANRAMPEDTKGPSEKDAMNKILASLQKKKQKAKTK